VRDRAAEREIREEQDAQYNESLAADRARDVAREAALQNAEVEGAQPVRTRASFVYELYELTPLLFAFAFAFAFAF
jgi:hypothetical protein